ncbi:MAG: hypothetical protein ABL984_07225 [Pyrinomonadaceae bacterium]
MKIGDYAILILIGLVLLLLSPILIPYLLIVLAWEFIQRFRFRRYLRRSEGKMFFCYTARKSSVEFVKERILPRLLAEVTVIYITEQAQIMLGDEVPFHVRIIEEMKAAGGGYPYVAKVVGGVLVAESVNEMLYRSVKRGVEPESTINQIEKFFAAKRSTGTHRASASE